MALKKILGLRCLVKRAPVLERQMCALDCSFRGAPRPAEALVYSYFFEGSFNLIEFRPSKYLNTVLMSVFASK